MQSIVYLVSTLFNLYLMVCLLRIWLQWARADFYNPFSQFIVKATHPILSPMRRVIPSIGKLDLASLVLAYLVALAKWLVLGAITGAAFDPLSFYLAAITVVKEAGFLLFWILIIRAIMSWVSQGQNPIEFVFHQLTEPFLAPIRRVIPVMGGLDLSLMVVLIGMNFINLALGDLLPLWRAI
ncbi:YggT family protein [Ferrimonas aestuarii]|uniref:YggT family protein n=1 Tax=Ferrimonas aestuarii TaxID=2569539 RepID=A0A4U1BGP5_9GAMM|nr:YggT family protein [Ferrimonas aestuarii]TKB50170.1 YggT family protein [Ferrimonas aestuarii]